MPTIEYRASDHRDWESAGLKEFGDFAECVEYRLERESGYGDTEGSWFYGDDDNLTIYFGTFGNDHSPGASHYTYAQTFDDRAEYLAEVKRLESLPEYLDDDSEETDDESEY